MPSSPLHRAAATLALLVIATRPALAQEEQCFYDAAAAEQRPLIPASTDERDDTTSAPVDVVSDDATLGVNGDASLSGNVRLRQGEREIRADRVEYQAERNAFEVEGNIEYHDPVIDVRGTRGRYSENEGAEFEGAQFEIPARPARGTAGRMSLDTRGAIDLENVTFTTCPASDPAWQLRAREIRLDTAERNGTGRSAMIEFKGVPIIYLPWMSFPLGSDRKSGFLFPSVGYSSRSGGQFSVPYYWNIAPNYDLSFEPVAYTRRGIDAATEFRYLTRRDRGTLAVNFLPNDRLYDDEDRSFLRLEHLTRLPAGWRFRIDAADASDVNYFEDFGQGPEGTSIAFVERLAELTYRDENWQIFGAVQDFQTIDQTLAPLDRPYSTLPQLAARGDFALGANRRFQYGFDSEAVNFDRSLGVNGWRFDAAPRVALEWQGPGYFLRPGVSLRYTSYSLDDNAPGTEGSPSRTLPTASVDAGLIFEGAAGSRGSRRVTLEPRMLYVYTPYRDQDDLPLFDTALPDLNLVQLFRTNRYVGADRVSDANQASVGVTSRLFSTQTGEQYLAVTLGQTYYFDAPRVRLPTEPDRDRSSSDFVAQLALTAFENWSADFGVQWDPSASERERMQARLQYRPRPDSVVNLGYRFQRDRLDQAEASAAWPVAKQWSLFARYVYSIEDSESLDQFAGLEYRACCWKLRAVGRRFVSSQTGERDTGIYVQLELGGLASVGSSAAAFLESAIRGYSPSTSTH